MYCLVASSKELSTFVDYVLSFYSPDSDLYPLDITREQVEEACQFYMNTFPTYYGNVDTIDREKVRDILIFKHNLKVDSNKLEFSNH